MLINKGYIGAELISKIFKGIELIFGASEPIGRVFPVGTGSDSLTVQLDDVGADWYPIQPNDKFVVAPGTYGIIRFQGDGQWGTDGNPIIITSTGVVNAGSIRLNGGAENVKIDFRNIGGNPLALKFTSSTNFYFGEQYDGVYGIRPVRNIEISGFECNVPVSGRIWQFLSDLIPYDNGTGQVAGDGIHFHNFKVNLPDSPTESVAFLFENKGSLDSSLDNGFIRNFTMRDFDIRGNSNCSAIVWLGNSGDPTGPAIFERGYIEGVNPTNTQHPRLIQVYGCGFFNRLKAKNIYGSLVGMFAQTRGSTPFNNIIINSIVDYTRKYSGFEFQTFPYQVIPGISTFGNGSIANCSTKDTGQGDKSYTSTTVEVYDMQGGTVYGVNNVAINPWNATSIGNVTTDVNNKVFTDSLNAKVNADLAPYSDSGLSDTGIYITDQIAEAGFDYNGGTRPNPPSIGAIEALSVPHPLVVPINFGDGTIPVTGWNNLAYVWNGDYQLVDYSGNPTTIGINNLANFSGGSSDPNAADSNFPDINVYKSDWWGDATVPSSMVFSGLDVSKAYKLKIIGNIESDTITKFNIVNEEGTSVSPTGFPTSPNLLDDSGYVVFDNITGIETFTLYCWKTTTYVQLHGAILIEKDNVPEPPEPPIELDDFSLSIQITGNTSAPSVEVSPLKYNKNKQIIMEWDDMPISVRDRQSDFEAATYNDGCGNNIVPVGSVATYIFKEFPIPEHTEIALMPNALTYADMVALINKGWDLSNHSFIHDNKPEYGTAREQSDECHNKIKLETGYEMNIGVIPSDYTGYTIAWEDMNYIGSTSQGNWDNRTPDWWNDWGYSGSRRLSIYPNPFTYLFETREFATDMNQGDPYSEWSPLAPDPYPWIGLQKLIDDPNTCTFHIGTHEIEAVNWPDFVAWLTKARTDLGDDYMMTSYREFVEYQYIRQRHSKTQNFSGGTLNVDFLFNNPLNKELSWHDVSFIVAGDGVIQNVTCNNPKFQITFNPTTRLINVKYRKTYWNNDIQPLTSVKNFIGCCAVHEDYNNGFDEQAFGTARLFSDRAWFEGDVPGDVLRFQFSRSGWYFDDEYTKFKNSEVEIITAIQKLAIDQTQVSNKPLNNTTDNPELAASYSNTADFFKQFAMRYGTVTYPAVDLRSDDKLSGLDLVKVIEIDNEPDRDWLGPDAYYEPEAYAALLSACYDAIKLADPNMKVSMGGVASSRNIWYLDRMKAWCEANRTDQKFPADIMAFHIYAFNNSIDWDNPPFPLPMDAESPEDGGFYNRAIEWVNWRNANASHCKVYVGEFGWDTNDTSPLRPRHITGTDNYELQARYVVRALLEFIAAGIERAQIFTIVDPGQDYDDTQHATNGLVSRTLGFTPKLSFTAVKEMFDALKEYKFTRTVRRNTVNIIEFKNILGDVCLAVWLPTATNDSQVVEIMGNNWTVTEKPIFIKEGDLP